MPSPLSSASAGALRKRLSARALRVASAARIGRTVAQLGPVNRPSHLGYRRATVAGSVPLSIACVVNGFNATYLSSRAGGQDAEEKARKRLSGRLGLNVPYEWWPRAAALKAIEAAGFSWVQVASPP